MATGDKKPVVMTGDIDSTVAKKLHAAQHAAGGSDPITPEMIGAASNPNLLHNWYFANLVNQRGQTEYSGNAYGIDMWVMTNLTSYGTLRVVDGGIQGHHADDGGYMNLWQKFEHDIVGTVTISVLIDGELYTRTGEMGAILSTLTEGIQVVAHPGNREFALRFFASASQKTVQAVKLELGSVQTLAHQDADGNWVLNEIPDYGEELAKCQRYYYQSWDGAEISSSGVILRDAFAQTRLGNVELPVTMRATPTITLYQTNGTANAVHDWLTEKDVVEGVTAVYANSKSFIPGLINGAFTVGTTYAFHYCASAEL